MITGLVAVNLSNFSHKISQKFTKIQIFNDKRLKSDPYPIQLT
jgi:hypothetical protein